ncbi:MAG: cobalamin biosynthesis protein CobQ [Silicimonas sp.]|nr:cobalamin biosynthesis protein CobQ [Silicimonas sp.]NND18601.1 cobalamin biosynthesis protein CobQ [Silicimonas sp.]NNL73780.1 cobalamin biosynthesis protein CobQ [Silicimonas sp.]RZW06522.1 MAG: cobalamin biosynthesis protein CobQ [Paracoccaceae bacterium]
MNTPAHLIFGASAFARPERRGTLPAALAGSLAPDLSLYVMVAVSIWVLDVPARTVFGEYYYSEAWQAVFAVDNSFIIWGGLLGIALWRGWFRLIAFAGAGFLHLCFDFPLHTHDARMHFWPITYWVFESPLSYWDNAAHAGTVGPMTLAMTLALTLFLWRRYRAFRHRLLFAALAAMEFLSSGIWRFIF